jgi:thymidylate synthase
MKYFNLLQNILTNGLEQKNKKGNIKFLINQMLQLSVIDIKELFDTYPVAKTKLKAELELYMKGVVKTTEYNKKGINWWDYCSPTMINTYPTYFKKLPQLIEQINFEKRSSKNYILFIGETPVEISTSQLPCLSLMQFQIINNELYITVYQRSADSNLGLPSDIYQTYLISQLIDVPLAEITFFIGNAHIYENNIDATSTLLITGKKPTFNLNV